MRAQSRDEAAAIHIYRLTEGEPVSFADIKAHIAACPDCVGANSGRVFFVLTAWRRSITATQRRSRR